MADIGGITGLLNAVVQRSTEIQQDSIDRDTDQTSTETEGNTQSAGAGTTTASNTIGEGAAFQPIESTGTDQNTNTDQSGAAGRVIEDQVSISAQAREALEVAQAGGSTASSPSEAIIEEATDTSPNLAFSANASNANDNTNEASANENTTDVAAVESVGSTTDTQTNQVQTNENDTGEVGGNADVTPSSSQNRELGQLVDQFA